MTVQFSNTAFPLMQNPHRFQNHLILVLTIIHPEVLRECFSPPLSISDCEVARGAIGATANELFAARCACEGVHSTEFKSCLERLGEMETVDFLWRI